MKNTVATNSSRTAKMIITILLCIQSCVIQMGVKGQNSSETLKYMIKLDFRKKRPSEIPGC